VKITRIKRGNHFTNVISAKKCELHHLRKALEVITRMPDAPMLMTEAEGLHEDILILTEEYLARYRSDRVSYPDHLKKLIESHIDKWKPKDKPIPKKRKKDYHKIEVT